MIKDFPYLYKIYNYNELALLKELKKYKTSLKHKFSFKTDESKLKKYNDKYYLIELDYSKNKILNQSADYFTEPIRIKCITNGNSIHNYFIENFANIMKIQELYNQRTHIYKQINYCSNFNICLSINILEIFKPKIWIDISSGWGDRLVSCICYNKLYTNKCHYYGCDPNKDLFKYYKKIITTYAKGKTKLYNIQNTGFIEAQFPNSVDLIFSSPPFFDVEIYSKYNNDSMKNANTIDLWIANFLKPMILKCYKLLSDKNGKLVLYIEDREKTPFINIMINYAKEIGFIYSGSIYYYYKDILKLRELFVFTRGLAN